MNTNLSGIRTVGKRGRERKPLHGMALEMRLSSIPEHVHVRMKLPGRKRWVNLGPLKIKNEVLDLPLPLAFLCHADEDRRLVQEIGDRLEEDGVVTWFAPDRLLPGDDWEATIEAAIEASDFVVVFLSEKSVNKKGYFQREVKRAFEIREELPDGERFIIPVLLDECEPPQRFKSIHWIRFGEPESYARLKKALSDLAVPA